MHRIARWTCALADYGIDPDKAQLVYAGGFSDATLAQIGTALHDLLGRNAQPIDRMTRVYVLHTAPATIEVVWRLELEPRDSTSSLLRCTVEANLPALLNIAATLALLPLFLRWHVQEETPLFASDIARKITAGRL